MRIYLAGGSLELLLCAQYIDALRAAGHVITYDWTQSFTGKHTLQEDHDQALADLNAVLSADVVWILVPADKSEGSHFEMGAALARGIRTIVSGPHLCAQHRIFPLLAAERYETHEAAFASLTV